MLRDEARNAVGEHFDTYSKGDVLVEQGQPIGEEQLILCAWSTRPPRVS